jgi:metal-responsive CopG/Arc/MetJ family transcriptional regulator
MASGKRTHVIAVSLPKELYRELEALRLRRFQKRSEIIKEAIRDYIEMMEGTRSANGLREAPARYEDEDTLTAADRAAIARAKAEIRRGEYVTLDVHNRKLRDVARRRSKKRR